MAAGWLGWHLAGWLAGWRAGGLAGWLAAGRWLAGWLGPPYMGLKKNIKNFLCPEGPKRDLRGRFWDQNLLLNLKKT